jgi:hypothetical protein
MPKLYVIADSAVDSWWQPLRDAGFEVYLFRESNGVELSKKLLGPVLWSEDLVADDWGGILTIDDLFFYVSMRRDRPPNVVAPGRVALHAGVVGPRMWITRAERRHVATILRELERQGAKRVW